jgi:LCP family protein required for cell wall assembly
MATGLPAPTPASRHGRSAGDRAARVRFRRAVALMLMTLVLPGSAQVVAGNRRVGLIALYVWFTVLLVAGAAALTGILWHGFVFWFVFDPLALGLLRLLLMALAVGWAVLFMDAWRLGQPLSLHLTHRRAVVGVNGVLSLTVAGVLLFGAHLVAVQRDFTLAMFGDGTASSPTAGRYNVLLLGGDSGAGRWGLRTDSMTVASIDEQTGRTVLIGLPRNMSDFPFRKGSVMHEQFPHGFDCEGCYLNGVNTWAGDNTQLFPHSDHPGIDATIMAIEGITGLKINYWAMVNLEGFKDLVDAVGGVTLKVRSPIAVGGIGENVKGYIQPGVRHLDGYHTLWFARTREDSDDYSRMARQKCVMNAMLHQISPEVALRNFEEIADASSQMVSTNIPASEVGTFLDLALKARDQKVSTVSLVPPLVETAHPDIPLIRSTIRDALERSRSGEPAAAPGGRKKHQAADRTTTGGSIGSLSGGYAANSADDLGSAC